jgi:Domain of unknown function (DU1801)
MAEAKTKPTKESVRAFLDRISDEERRRDCLKLVRLMKRAAGAPPKMWGAGIVGFGSYRYVYASGREGDWPVAAFAPRKRDLTLYIMSGFGGHAALLRKLGRHKTAKCCLYIKRLADVDLELLEQLVLASVKEKKRRHA